MIKIPGIFFDGKSARAHPCVMISDGVIVSIEEDKGVTLLSEPVLKKICRITPRLGDTRRVIMFHNGQRFETDDLQGVAQLEKAAGVNSANIFVNFLENRWKTVAGCLIALVAAVFLGINLGIPVLAKTIAFGLPPDIMNRISMETEQALDKRFFNLSGLDDRQKADIREAFFALARDLGADASFSLQFRKSKVLGANAFALPSGRIIMTDKLVDMAENIRELEGILVHEMAHVAQRHGLRSVIQKTGVVVLISLLAGDVTSITSLAASIPTLLVESGYSRQFEKEADEAVGSYYISKNWDIRSFEDILIRITKGQPKAKGVHLISTHPEIRERIQHLRKFIAKAGNA